MKEGGGDAVADTSPTAEAMHKLLLKKTQRQCNEVAAVSDRLRWKNSHVQNIGSDVDCSRSTHTKFISSARDLVNYEHKEIITPQTVAMRITMSLQKWI